jgi:hypothetical protein
MTLQLPTPIQNYYAAEAGENSSELAQCFGEQARVRDEGRTHIGRAAITEWMVEAKRKYSHTTEPLSVVESDGQFVVTAKVSGKFPGSPIELSQRFEIDGDKIASLEIG